MVETGEATDVGKTDEGVGRAAEKFAQVLLSLGLDQLSTRDLEQPLVFFRVDWDFRWLSRAAVAQLVAGEDLPPAAMGLPKGREAPSELHAFIEAAQQRLDRSADHALVQWPDLGSPLQRRDVLVLPGGWHRDDAWTALDLGVALAAAIVLPPEEGAFAWTVTWARPTVIVAAFDQLTALDTELEGGSRRRARRALRRVRLLVGADGPHRLDQMRALSTALPTACRLRELQPNPPLTT